ncbi:MAG TPA: F0F1 ATP synthase subunit epsilon [Phycisphaerales bacterium]|nr:F0F1 ATP synthase subunit epsilon [Phycisphaerales bacterium]
MAKKTFRCRLVTPTASLLDDAVTYASVPAWDGLMGFLPGRAPILAKLGCGELVLRFPDTDKGQGGERSYVVDGGVVQMQGETLTILAEYAEAAEQINPADAQAELKTAMGKSAGSGTGRAAAQEKIDRERERARVKVRIASGAAI